jgi:hypothetical protein
MLVSLRDGRIHADVPHDRTRGLGECRATPSGSPSLRTFLFVVCQRAAGHVSQVDPAWTSLTFRPRVEIVNCAHGLFLPASHAWLIPPRSVAAFRAGESIFRFISYVTQCLNLAVPRFGITAG